jgi:hypothetical protein
MKQGLGRYPRSRERISSWLNASARKWTNFFLAQLHWQNADSFGVLQANAVWNDLQQQLAQLLLYLFKYSNS